MDGGAQRLRPDVPRAAADAAGLHVCRRGSGEVDVIVGYTSDGLIAQYDLVTLADPKQAIPPYDAILLLSPRRADDAALKAALQPLLGKIDIATMREANLRAGGSQGAASTDGVARWIWEKVGGK